MKRETCGYPSCGCFSILGDVTKGPQPGCPKGLEKISGSPGLARLKANSDYDAVVDRTRAEQERAMREVREGRTGVLAKSRKPKKEGYPKSK